MATVTVVGAGIVGLTAAIRCAEAGYDVTVVAAERPPAGASAVAGAIWYPYLAGPPEAVTRWAATSYEVLAEEARRSPHVRPLALYEVVHPGTALPPWADAAGARHLTAAELQARGWDAGWTFPTFVVRAHAYVDELVERARAVGVSFRFGTVRRLEEVEGDAVVHAAGLGARSLVGDGRLVPVRGQVVWMADPGIDEVRIDERDPDRFSYTIPRGAEVVVGGTAEPGREDLEPDPDQARRIVADGVALEPRLARSEIVDVRVGLRPFRPVVRVERASLADGRPVVHDYGHGGAGFTLAWGCAAEVVASLEDDATPIADPDGRP